MIFIRREKRPQVEHCSHVPSMSDIRTQARITVTCGYALLASSLLHCFTMSCRADELRKWTSRRGQAVEAALVRQATNGVVILRRADGGQVSIPRANLSLADQAYITELTAKAKKRQHEKMRMHVKQLPYITQSDVPPLMPANVRQAALLLASPDPQERERGAVALGEMGMDAQSATPLLARAVLEQPAEGQREYLPSNIGDMRANVTIGSYVGQRAAVALVQIGGASAQPLLELLERNRDNHYFWGALRDEYFAGVAVRKEGLDQFNSRYPMPRPNSYPSRFGRHSPLGRIRWVLYSLGPDATRPLLDYMGKHVVWPWGHHSDLVDVQKLLRALNDQLPGDARNVFVRATAAALDSPDDKTCAAALMIVRDSRLSSDPHMRQALEKVVKSGRPEKLRSVAEHMLK